MGYLNGVFPRGEKFLPAVYKIASSIASGVSPASTAIAKRQLYTGLLRGEVGDAIEDSKNLIGEFMKEAGLQGRRCGLTGTSSTTILTHGGCRVLECGGLETL
jgi:enoyl-CoA hydratase/carnithine racemase